MKIAIISDVHNNEVNLKKVLIYCTKEKIKTIICCGDLASQETLNFFARNFSGVGHYVFGNMDDDQMYEMKDEKQYKNIYLYNNFGEVEIAEQRIAFTHYPQRARKLCGSGRYSFVFYGHTHKPWTENINNCVMLNPGNVAGELFSPSFAVWETATNKFDLVRVHDLKG